MTGIFLTSQGQYLKIRQMAGKRHFVVCEIQIFGYCPENFCGYNCSVPCHCRIPGPMKDKLTAVCTSGCAGRATGRNGLCNHVCSNTTWGEECTYQCGHCNNGESCNASNGHCKTCTAGYKPTPKCEDECDLGKYGLNCSRNCGHCGLELDCEKVSGNCSAGCDAGWNGTLCDQECENGTYGSNCSETCGNCVAGCKKGTGTCLGGCLSGFKGETCKYIDQEITQGIESPQSDSSTGHNCSPKTRMHQCHLVFDITAVDRFSAMQVLPCYVLLEAISLEINQTFVKVSLK
ncbi:multiple epidermal growth factor-like domains protein 6 isoform X1 [Mya arenaria]|uniref:multiple epidermal growth factor-like domains protein 6 isoform X1 n=1 Tax=Mya arenaria TaxID=6604 RepID=UPI0022E1E88C|nr:multiple epidermal growth factor-like domains protein 6 isoform X1 [Mya arenaria]